MAQNMPYSEQDMIDPDAKETLKWLLILMVFPLGGPLLGVFLRHRPAWQNATFALMCFMTINGFLSPGNWGLTLDSQEFYRGHTKGYHFYFNHTLGIALAVSALLENSSHRFRIPAGSAAYLLYCFASSLSLFWAENLHYHFMALHKMLFVLCLFFGAFAYLNTKRRILYFFQVMAVILLWECLAVLKTRYIDGQYQSRGTFEHQNALAMYAILISMPILSLAMGSDNPRNKFLFAGFCASCIIVVAALSRASLLVFGFGISLVLIVCLIHKPTQKKLLFIGAFSLIAFVGALISMDTIVSRFNDSGNIASEEYRRILNNAALAMVKDYPMGIGWNNYALLINAPYEYADFVWNWMAEKNHSIDENRQNSCVESHYFLLLAENGWGGLLSYGFLIILTLFRNLRASITPGDIELQLISFGIAMGCSMNYLQSAFERVLTQPRNLMLWIILFAVSARIESWRKVYPVSQPMNSIADAEMPERIRPSSKASMRPIETLLG